MPLSGYYSSPSSKTEAPVLTNKGTEYSVANAYTTNISMNTTFALLLRVLEIDILVLQWRAQTTFAGIENCKKNEIKQILVEKLVGDLKNRTKIKS